MSFRSGGVTEAAIGRGRDAGLGAEILRETLRPFEAGGGPARAEDGDPGGGERIGDAGDERLFRPDDDEADAVIAAERDDGGMVGRIEGNEFRLGGDAGIAGRGGEARNQRRAAELPGKRVLTPTRSDQKNMH